MTEVGDEGRDVDVGRARAMAGRRLALQAEPLRAGLAPDVAFPLRAVVAQRTAERPGGSQPLRGELERHLVERGEMGGLAAAECDLGHEASRARQKPAHRGVSLVGEQPGPIERTPRLLDHAHAVGHHHQGGRRRGDARGRQRQRLARQVGLRQRQEATEPIVENEHGVRAFRHVTAAPVVDLVTQVARPRQLDQAALPHAAAQREQ